MRCEDGSLRRSKGGKGEEGQAIVMVALAMGIFLLGAVGLTIDGARLYSERQMAQAAADASAVAGIMSIFDDTNGVSGNTAGFSTGSAFTCTSTDARTPCAYAIKNGYGNETGDTVTVSFPADSAAPGVTFSTVDPVNLIQVTISRPVSTTLMRLLGPTATTVTTTAMAAIVAVESPTPILVTHPTLSNSLSMNGNTSIVICGGPTRSVEVNSSSASAYGGGGTVDLSHAGPADPGNCTTGTGADFGVFGGDTTNPGVELGTTGHYISPASPVQDPLANVPAPSVPTTNGTTSSIKNGTDGCTNSNGCTLYSPGLWKGGLTPGKTTVMFEPGLYYVQGGGVDFKQTVGGGTNDNAMCVGCAADPNTGSGMVIYDTGPAGSTVNSNPSGGFTIGTQASLVLQGATNTTTNANGQSVPGPPYYGILFWEDRTANANSHQLGQGNGCFTLIGTVYITNTQAIMEADPTHYQGVEYNGTPCSTTVQQGNIIVGTLTLKGTVNISMNLVPYGFLTIRQVALVN